MYFIILDDECNSSFCVFVVVVKIVVEAAEIRELAHSVGASRQI